jgi:DNA adenine methylase
MCSGRRGSWCGLRISFGANGYSFAVRRQWGGKANARKNLLAGLKAAHDRLGGVAIENVSWEQCVKTYDGPETFFFFDPPYLCPDIKAYASWTEKDLRAMAKLLRRIKGRWILTINDCALARELFAGRPMIEVSGQSAATKVTTGKVLKELIIQSQANE